MYIEYVYGTHNNSLGFGRLNLFWLFYYKTALAKSARVTQNALGRTSPFRSLGSTALTYARTSAGYV